jgi:hypothetical protein
MPNEPVDPVVTAPPTQPTVPTIADLLPARARAYIYALLPVLLIAVAVFDLPNVVDKAVLILNAAGFGVAFSNVPRTTDRFGPRATGL